MKTYEADENAFSADAYSVKGHGGIAWHVLGWETKETEDTHWDGIYERTDNVVCIMVGDDHKFSFPFEDLKPLDREAYCGSCGQIGCCHDGLPRE